MGQKKGVETIKKLVLSIKDGKLLTTEGNYKMLFFSGYLDKHVLFPLEK